MSNEPTPRGGDRAAEEAAGWFVRLADPAADGGDWLAFEAWLAASPAHLDAYDRLERIWVDLEADPDAFHRVLDPVALRPAPRRGNRPAGRAATRRAWLAGAGAIAATVVVAFEVANRPADSLVLRAAPGQTRQFVLADGTHINLNAGSVLRVELGRDARRVSMTDAEAVFDVAHDPKRPFLIASGDREVRVVGTMFNLRQREGQMALSVRRGVVEVRPADAPGAAATRVTVGQQFAHVTGGGSTLSQDERADAAFAWTSGQLIYRGQPLSEVAADLTRRFGTPVRTADADAAALKFSGVLVLDNEAAVLRRIEAFAPVRAVSTPGGVILQRRAVGG